MAPPRQCFPGQARLSLPSSTCSTRPCPPGTPPPAHSSPRPSPDEALSQPAGSTSPSRGPALLSPSSLPGPTHPKGALPWASSLSGVSCDLPGPSLLGPPTPGPAAVSRPLKPGSQEGPRVSCTLCPPPPAWLPPLGHRLSPATCSHLFHHLSPGLLPPAHPQAVPHSSRALT